MARWDKFLTAASRGYGTGFNRYQQYQNAKNERLNRADLKEAMAAYEETEGQDPTFSTETSLRDGGSGALPTGTPFRQADGSIKYEAVAGPSRSKAVETTLPEGSPPHLGAMHGVGGDPQRALPSEMIDEALAPIEGLTPKPEGKGDHLAAALRLQGVPEERIQQALNRGTAAEDGRSEYVTRPDTEQKKEALPTSEKEATEQTVDEVLGFIIPKGSKKTKSAVKESVLSGDRTSTRDAWDRMESKLRDVYVRKGDIEALMGLDAKVSAMQHERMNTHMNEAMRLIGVDPEAAASSLYKAYSYYPDGVKMDLRVKNGKLYGYGYDEETGKFQGGMQLDEASLADLVENFKDPIAFQKSKKAARIAAEERRYKRNIDNRNYALEDAKARSTHALNLSKIAKNKAQGVATYIEAMGGSGSNYGGWKDTAQLDKFVQDVHKYANNMMSGDAGTGMADSEYLMWGPESPLGAGAGTRMLESLALELDPRTSGYASPAKLVDVTNRLMEAEMLLSNVTGDNANMDTDALAMAGITQIADHPKPGYSVIVVDNKPFTIQSALIPNLAAYKPPSPEAVAAAEPAPAPTPDSTAYRAGQVVGDTVGGALNTGIGAVGSLAKDATTVPRAIYGFGKEHGPDFVQGLTE